MINHELHQVTEFSTLEDFLSNETVPAGISTIYIGGLPIDILVSPGSSKATIFFFHGAIEPHFTLPVLSGLGISGGLVANRVFISDPSLILNNKLLLSWYAGNERQPNLQRDLVTIIEKIVTSLGSERTIFFGGSGGGFAALYFASLFENSTAAVFNPQTNLARYSKRAVQAYVETAFQRSFEEDDPFASIADGIVTDLCKQYSTRRYCEIFYMQNRHDVSHVDNHLVPFLRSMHPNTNVHLLSEGWGAGHLPPPRQLLSQVLDIIAMEGDRLRELSSLGFRAI